MMSPRRSAPLPRRMVPRFSSATRTEESSLPKRATIRRSPASSISRPSSPTRASRSPRSSRTHRRARRYRRFCRRRWLSVPRSGEVPRFVRGGRRRRGGRFHGRLPSAVGPRGAGRRGHGAAWKAKPSWYLVATEDKMIPPRPSGPWPSAPVRRVVEEKGSHAIYVSQPKAVADIIAKAANDVALPTRSPRKTR